MHLLSYAVKDLSTKKVRALFFLPSLRDGGVDRVMVEILSHIDRERIDPVLVLFYPCENSPYRDRIPGGMKVIVIQRKSDSSIDKIKQYADFLKGVFRESPHVIVSMMTPSNVMAISAGLLFGKKVIIGEHTTLSEATKITEGRRILWFSTTSLVKLFYRFADRIIAVSEGVKADLAEEFNIPPGNMEVIHNPIDLKRISELCNAPVEHGFFAEGVPVILSAGRLDPQKGFDTLLKSFSDIIRRMDARLIILGEGPEKEFLCRLAVELAIAEKVSFLGFQSNPYKFIARADVFVLSSRLEGLPMVILEAMACETPVISTDCKSGPYDILQNGKYGILVDTDNTVALSMSVLKLLNDKMLRERFSRLGKQRVKDFAVDKVTSKYEEIIYRSAGVLR
jgi:glycosyltransferase involved in cell wall biosynthesis